MADASNHFYYYIYNVQGDVIALADADTGKIAATYTYDAWGKCVSIENAAGFTVGNENPFRYKGYYFDTETGLYYLNSRYYDPEVGRFVNADSFLTTDITDALSANMFVYCLNNPINRSDPTGEVPLFVLGAALGIMEQFMTDVLFAMATGQALDECFSSVGTYAAAAFSGALATIPGGGFFRVGAEIILSSTIQTSIDVAFTPKEYEESSPYRNALENTITISAPHISDKKTSAIVDKPSKPSASKGSFYTKVSKKSGSIIKSVSKYCGNAIGIFLRIFKR